MWQGVEMMGSGRAPVAGGGSEGGKAE